MDRRLWWRPTTKPVPVVQARSRAPPRTARRPQAATEPQDYDANGQAAAKTLEAAEVRRADGLPAAPGLLRGAGAAPVADRTRGHGGEAAPPARGCEGGARGARLLRPPDDPLRNLPLDGDRRPAARARGLGGRPRLAPARRGRLAVRLVGRGAER